MDLSQLFSRHEKRDFEVPVRPVPVRNKVVITTVAAICLFVATISVLLRIWTRTFVSRAFGADDWVMIITLVFFTVFCGIVIGLNILVNNKSSFNSEMLTKSTAILITSEVFYCVTMLTLKISLAIFFLRVMVEPWQKRCTYIIVTGSTLAGIANICFSIFFCGLPVNATIYWERRLEGSCVGYTANLVVNYVFSVVTASTDLLLALIAIPMIIQAKIGKKEKWIVAGIFGVAIMGFVASVIRIRWLSLITVTGATFWDDMELLAIWSMIEPGMGITAASAATLRPLLRRIFGTKPTASPPFTGNVRWFGSDEKSSDTDQNSRLGSPRRGKGQRRSSPFDERPRDLT